MTQHTDLSIACVHDHAALKISHWRKTWMGDADHAGRRDRNEDGRCHRRRRLASLAFHRHRRQSCGQLGRQDQEASPSAESPQSPFSSNAVCQRNALVRPMCSVRLRCCLLIIAGVRNLRRLTLSASP